MSDIEDISDVDANDATHDSARPVSVTGVQIPDKRRKVKFIAKFPRTGPLGRMLDACELDPDETNVHVMELFHSSTRKTASALLVIIGEDTTYTMLINDYYWDDLHCIIFDSTPPPGYFQAATIMKFAEAKKVIDAYNENQAQHLASNGSRFHEYTFDCYDHLASYITYLARLSDGRCKE
jgi:hypothetical protein